MLGLVAGIKFFFSVHWRKKMGWALFPKRALFQQKKIIAFSNNKNICSF